MTVELKKKLEMLETISYIMLAIILNFAKGEWFLAFSIILSVMCYISLTKQVKKEGGFINWIKTLYN